MNKKEQAILKQEFMNACITDDVKKVNNLIIKGVALPEIEENAFIYCAKYGSLNVMKLLTKNIKIAQFIDKALCAGSASGHVNIIEYLIKKGADVQTQENYCIKLSAENGHLDIVKLLIEEGANIHENNDYALFSSCSEGHLEVVKYLIEHGAELHVHNNKPLRYAAYAKKIDVVKYLISKGASIHDNGEHAFVHNVEKGEVEMVEYLYSIYKDKKIPQKIIRDKDNEYIKKWLETKLLNEKLESELNSKDETKKMKL